MKAILCESLGLPSSLVYKEIESLTPGPEEIIISTKACAVNFPDTLIIQGKYQVKPELPFSPGSDISGIVKSVGFEVKTFKAGDEVFGVVPYGGYAEEVRVQPTMIFPKPPSMSFPIAASFLYAYGTSLHALKDRAQLKAGETLVVLGASGGVGLAAVDIGKMMGARVIAAASTAEKLKVCQQYGADELINYTDSDLKASIKELTNGKGADVICDPVGGSYTEGAVRATAWGGRYLVVGFAAGQIPSLPLNLALLKGCSVVGVFWGRFTKENPQGNMENGQQILQWYKEGKIKPHIYKTYPLSQAPKALEDMMQRKVIGKVIIEI